MSKNKTVTLHMNAKLQPEHMQEFYRQPLAELLDEEELGYVTDAKTLRDNIGEFCGCEITIECNRGKEEELVDYLKKLSIPCGSFLTVGRKNIPVGKIEGMAVYINGTDLPDEVYKTCSVKYVREELCKLFGGELAFVSYWEGTTETAIYFYGESFHDMQSKSEAFIKGYPLCAGCRVVRVC